MKLRRRGDFAFLETGAIGITAVALGVAFFPKALEENYKIKRLQALAEVEKISVGILKIQKDFGSVPNSAGDKPLGVLKGPGQEPIGGSWLQGEKGSLLILTQPTGGESWHGPYLETLNPDPWGHAYLINVQGFQDEGKVWILSAGPNGIIDTDKSEKEPKADDIGVIAY